MAYRRRHGITRSATFVEDHRSSGDSSSPAMASPRATRFADDSRRTDRSTSLGTQAMRASAARQDFHASSSLRDHRRDSGQKWANEFQVAYVERMLNFGSDSSIRSLDDELSKQHEAKHGFWGVLARKAKIMLDENGDMESYDSRNQVQGSSEGTQPPRSRWSYDQVRNPTLQIGPEGILDIGGKIKNALEDGLTMGENSMVNVLQAQKLQIRRKATSMDMQNLNLSLATPDMSPLLTDEESTQLKASRDVANAMAAKVKLLQRELKTVKADLSFAKERCAQLEEENRVLRDGDHDADEDLIRRQLETLLGEKARLANENTVYARENRFLREIVEFHQLNMQDVVNLDEDIEDDGDGDANAAEAYDVHMLSLSRPAHEAPFPTPFDVHMLSPSGPAQEAPFPAPATAQSPSTRLSRTNSCPADTGSPMHKSFKDG